LELLQKVVLVTANHMADKSIYIELMITSVALSVVDLVSSEE